MTTTMLAESVCLESDLSPAAASFRLAGDLIEA
jgi:hypothetical protein